MSPAGRRRSDSRRSDPLHFRSGRVDFAPRFPQGHFGKEPHSRTIEVGSASKGSSSSLQTRTPASGATATIPFAGRPAQVAAEGEGDPRRVIHPDPHTGGDEVAEVPRHCDRIPLGVGQVAREQCRGHHELVAHPRQQHRLQALARLRPELQMAGEQQEGTGRTPLRRE